MSKPNWKNIILHHSATADGKALNTAALREGHLRKGWADIGYHFIIEQVDANYEIIVGRMLDREGAHCPDHGRNWDSIGICVVGNFETSVPIYAQKNALVKLCKALCKQFNIPPAQIYPHREFSNTLCPGKNFGIAAIRQRVVNAILYNHYIG
jgi:hypothetical protein